MITIKVIIIINIIVSILVAVYYFFNIISYPSGTKSMLHISDLITYCSNVFMKKQYQIISVIGLLIAMVIYMFLGLECMTSFILGAVSSAIIGLVGMIISVRANVRTANAARLSDLDTALKISFRSGAITGLMVVSLSLVSISSIYFILFYFHYEDRVITNSLISLSLGASTISMFARLGGGIFTKAADISADLVGKLEMGIKEDDIRNPAVIADNVGDNVGDCAGMAADLYETCCVTVISAIMIMNMLNIDAAKDIILYPLLFFSSASLATIISTISLANRNKNIFHDLYNCLKLSALVIVMFSFIINYYYIGWETYYGNNGGKHYFASSLIGIITTLAIVKITEYYTSPDFKPTQKIAEASNSGHASNIIQGFAFSLESTLPNIIVIVLSILTSYKIAGITGITLNVVSMISLSGIITTLDAYGPVTDNAGGIIEMSGIEESAREITDRLDSVGNITKAVTKGYSIASAGLGSIILFILYCEDLSIYFPNININFSISNPFIVAGLFIGGGIPYIFAAISINSVSKVSLIVVKEVRKQLKNINNMDTFKPNYKKVIEILTTSSLKHMILPSLLPISIPIIVYLSVLLLFDMKQAFMVLGSIQLGSIITGIFLAISMTTGGGSWDNAKKYIEDGNLGGKNSDAHKASITGDTVGDPLKDTSGPAINPLIKIVNLTSLLIVIISYTITS